MYLECTGTVPYPVIIGNTDMAPQYHIPIFWRGGNLKLVANKTKPLCSNQKLESSAKRYLDTDLTRI
jgi:hypothetical protein